MNAIAGFVLSGLLILGGCSPSGPDATKRLDALEARVATLEKDNAGQTPGARAPISLTPSSPEPAYEQASTYRLGAVALARAAPAQQNLLDQVPTDTVGSFIYQGGSVALDDLSPQGVRYVGRAGIELQGWLKVSQAGRFQLAIDYTASGTNFILPTCILLAWIEDRQIGSQQVSLTGTANTSRATPVVGAQLQPGLYKLRIWMACSSDVQARIAATVLIKTPSDMNLRAIHPDEFVHKD